MKRKPTASRGKFALVWMTTPNRTISLKISRLLVDGRLAACVNILPGIKSRYWWKGKIVTASEELLAAKTLVSKIPELESAVREAHPYEVCEVISLSLTGGSAPYLRWITESLGAEPGNRRGN